MKMLLLVLLASLYVGISGAMADGNPYPWLATYDANQSLSRRFPLPDGYERVETPPGSFGAWLRGLPLKAEGAKVHLHTGEAMENQTTHAAVIDLDVGTKDLQQCADAIMRLRAEYLWSQNRKEDIAFKFTSGDLSAYEAWSSGKRPVVTGNKVRWAQSAEPADDRATFASYMEKIFLYAGTSSMRRDTKRVGSLESIQPGDFFIQPATREYYGHAELVVDMAKHKESGKVIFLLANSFMPAQEMHLHRNPGNPELSPWFLAGQGDRLSTPKWTFKWSDLYRFP